jgi:hypothetical protein
MVNYLDFFSVSKSATFSICFQICKPTVSSMLEMSITSSSICCRNAQPKTRSSIKLLFPFEFPDLPRLSKSPTTSPLPQLPYITKSKSKLKPTVQLVQFRVQRLCLFLDFKGGDFLRTDHHGASASPPRYQTA